MSVPGSGMSQCSGTGTSRDERAQVSPAIAAVELTPVAIETFGAKRVGETVGRVRRFTEQEHRGHAAVHESPRDSAEKDPPEAAPLNTLHQVDLDQIAG